MDTTKNGLSIDDLDGVLYAAPSYSALPRSFSYRSSCTAVFPLASFIVSAFQYIEMVMLETNLDGMLDATKNYLSVTDSDYALDATPSDGSLDTPACTGVCIYVVAVFFAHIT